MHQTTVLLRNDFPYDFSSVSGLQRDAAVMYIRSDSDSDRSAYIMSYGSRVVMPMGTLSVEPKLLASPLQKLLTRVLLWRDQALSFP